MKRASLLLGALLTSQCCLADGLPLKNGRFPGAVIDLVLTPGQKSVIEHYRTCQLERSSEMNVYTPYVFELTAAQTALVSKRVGFAPKRFQIYETVRGFNDAGPHWNLALRYSEDRIEIPIKLLLNARAAEASHREQGWKTENPCFPALAPR